MNSPWFVYRELERDIDQPVFIYLVSLSSHRGEVIDGRGTPAPAARAAHRSREARPGRPGHADRRSRGSCGRVRGRRASTATLPWPSPSARTGSRTTSRRGRIQRSGPRRAPGDRTTQSSVTYQVSVSLRIASPFSYEVIQAKSCSIITLNTTELRLAYQAHFVGLSNRLRG